MILEEYKLSYNAFPSIKNSGENIMLSVSNISLTFLVYPTRTLYLNSILDYFHIPKHSLPSLPLIINENFTFI